MTDRDYCYPPDYTVLRNRLAIRNAADLDRAERQFVVERAAQLVPQGDFDLNHLRAIHRHLFQDIYEWAGEIRTVELSKRGQQFQLQRYIETGMADVSRRIAEARYFRGASPADFAQRAGIIIGDVNFAHPFREGNGRTQLQYLKQLGERAGYELELSRIQRDSWGSASREAHDGNYGPLSDTFGLAIQNPDPADDAPDL